MPTKFPVKVWHNEPEELTPVDSESLEDAETRLGEYIDAHELHWRAPVKTHGELLALEEKGNVEGDLRFVEETKQFWSWNGVAKEWQEPLVTVLHWRPPVTKEAELPTEHNVTGDVRIVTETLTLWIWTGTEWKKPALSGTTTITESCTWSIAGTLTPGVVPGPFRKIETNETQHLLGIECVLGVGKSTLKLLHNGTGIAELTAVKAKTSVVEVKLVTPLSLATTDNLALEIVSAEESAAGLAFSAFIKHVATVV